MGRRPPAIDEVKSRALLLLVAGSLSVAGCAPRRVAFTQGIRAQYNLSGEELKNLQYYVSGDITLQRDFRREEGEVSKGHKLVAKEGGLLETVLIPAGTPGIASEVGETSLSVSFEPGSSLIFGSPPTDRDPERKYRLSAKRWADYYGEIVYEGKIFYAVEGSGQAYLEVAMESLDAVEKRKKVLPGMTLPGK